MLMGEELKKFIEQLEADGEEEVRQGLAMGKYGNVIDPTTRAPLVQDWLNQKESQRQETKREEELKIGKEANDIAKEANRIATSAKDASWWAIRIAIISIIISILVAIFK
jgi:hypothetical protein